MGCKLEKKIIYFEKAGKINTEQTLRLAKERAIVLGINTIVIASSSGYTAKKAFEILGNTNCKLVIGGISRQRFSSELLKILEEKGVLVRFSSEVEYSYPEQMRNALNKLSTGIKVVMDLGMIVAEEGLVLESEEVIAIAGTGRSGGRFPEGGGADTAVVMVPRRSEDFNRLPEKKDDRREIREIICKPR